jgi:hypothetical protein
MKWIIFLSPKGIMITFTTQKICQPMCKGTQS